MRNPFRGKKGKPSLKADWLIVGLGNPGSQYSGNRHNVGSWAVAEIARRAGTQFKTAGAHMHAGVGTLGGETVAVVRPKTFMNNSGRAVHAALGATGCDLAHTIVIYDELDLPVGALRVREGGGTGGNNGLKSIAASSGLDFVRIRIGIGRPHLDGKPTRDPEMVADYVLTDPPDDERQVLREIVAAAADAAETVITGGVDLAGNRFNLKPKKPGQPAPPKPGQQENPPAGG